MRLHFQEQNLLYGEQKLVNLLNHKGYEQPVKEAYEKYVAQVCLIVCPHFTSWFTSTL